MKTALATRQDCTGLLGEHWARTNVVLAELGLAKVAPQGSDVLRQRTQKTHSLESVVRRCRVSNRQQHASALQARLQVQHGVARRLIDALYEEDLTQERAR